MQKIEFGSLIASALILAGAASPVPKVGSCPSGYFQSGGFCAPINDKSKRAIPKGSSQCPSGWVQSGAYCLEVSR